ncbi:MAG: thioredoxin family protein [Patescibacteria group bacterium]
MNIKILGSGCQNCQKLENNVKKALEELDLKANVEKITDIVEIMKYDVMSMPALVIDEKLFFSGKVGEIKEIKEILQGQDLEEKELETKNGGCGCCGCDHC